MIRRAIVLGLDGVLVHSPADPTDADGPTLAVGAAEALQRASWAGFQTLVVTHAPQVARGELDAIDLADYQQRLRDRLAESGARLDGIYTCVHDAALGPPCDCLKPAPGLLERARDEMGIDLERSWVVGRRPRDWKLAEAVGARVLAIGDRSASGADSLPPHVEDLGQAIRRIVEIDPAAAPVAQERSRS